LKVGEKKENRFQRIRDTDVEVHSADVDRDQGREIDLGDVIDQERVLGTGEAREEEVIEVEPLQDDAEAEVETEAVIEVVGGIENEVGVKEEAAIVGRVIAGVIVTVVEDKNKRKRKVVI